MCNQPILDNSRHKAPLVIQQQAERSDVIKIVRAIPPYQDNRVPFGAWLKR